MRALLLGLALVGLQAAATEVVPYVHMSVCDSKPHKSPRAYWDAERKFCFEKDGQTFAFSLSDMGEIKLRQDGEWANNDYVSALSVENREEVGTYSTYFVRYLSLSEPVTGVIPFVAHVFFSWGPGKQTIYVFGEMNGEDVRITGYSNGNSWEGDLRAAVNTIKSLGAVFEGLNPNRVGVDLTKSEDRRRIRAVDDVVQKYQSDKARGQVAPKLP